MWGRTQQTAAGSGRETSLSRGNSQDGGAESSLRGGSGPLAPAAVQQASGGASGSTTGSRALRVTQTFAYIFFIYQ